MDELTRALLAQQQGAARLPELELQLERANALRDQQYNANGQYRMGGVGAGMGAIANMMGASRGMKQAKAVQPQIQQARSQIGEGQMGAALYKARQAEEKIARDAQIRAEDMEMRRAAEAESRRRHEQRMAMDERRLGASLARAAAIKDQKDKGANLTKDERAAAISTAQGADALGKLESAAEKGLEIIRPINMPSKLIQEMADTAQAHGWMSYFTSPPTAEGEATFGRRLAEMFASPEELADFKRKMADSANWHANIQMNYALDKQHALFGAQLSKHEQNSWNKALNIHPGMDPEDVLHRVRLLKNYSIRNAYKAYNRAVGGGNTSNVGLMREILLNNTLATEEQLAEGGRLEIPPAMEIRREVEPDGVPTDKAGGEDKEDAKLSWENAPAEAPTDLVQKAIDRGWTRGKLAAFLAMKAQQQAQEAQAEPGVPAPGQAQPMGGI